MRYVLPLLALAVASVASVGCGVKPGFAADDDAVAGPSIRVVADVDASNASKATLHVLAHALPDVLGVSAHVRVDNDAVAVDSAKAGALFGATADADDVRTIAAVDGADVAVGGSHTTAVQSAIEDGVEVATIEVHGKAAASSRVDVVDAVARTADGAFVPLHVSAGTITLEVAP